MNNSRCDEIYIYIFAFIWFYIWNIFLPFLSRLQQILEFGLWQANHSFFFLAVGQWDWRTNSLVSWPSPTSGPRAIMGFRGQQQEPQTARMAGDRFGREKENNRYSHTCSFTNAKWLAVEITLMIYIRSLCLYRKVLYVIIFTLPLWEDAVCGLYGCMVKPFYGILSM